MIMIYSIDKTVYCLVILLDLCLDLAQALSLSSSPLSIQDVQKGSITFSSCAAPAFDTFAEPLVAEWSVDNDYDDEATIFAVEEVMRSCGGAVQGITEQAAENRYLNRADDGFQFCVQTIKSHDNNNIVESLSTYSWGPTTLDQSNSDGQPPPCLASLSLQKGQRVLSISTSSSSINPDEPPLLLQKQTFASSSQVESPRVTLLDLKKQEDTIDLSKQICWTNHIRCRMPSVSMPWMTQRLQWQSWEQKQNNANDSQGETRGENDNATADETTTTTTIKASSIALTSPMQLAQSLALPMECWVVNDNDDATTTGRVLATAICSSSRVAAVSREYSSVDGKLVNILWSFGSISTRRCCFEPTTESYIRETH